MSETTAATWADFTDAELVKLISFLADDVEFATLATDGHAAERQHAAIDRLHAAALEQHARRESAAEARVLDARIALVKPWMPITIGGDTGQTGTIVIERDTATNKIVKAKIYLWSRGEGVGPSVGRWADLLTEHWFLPAPERTAAHMRTLDARFLGEQLEDAYLKGGPLYTAAIEELYDRAVFEAEAREESDDEWTRGALAAAAEWNRPWPGEQAPASA
jgi:hypothetical protein